jgi:hypothetical protein
MVSADTSKNVFKIEIIIIIIINLIIMYLQEVRWEGIRGIIWLRIGTGHGLLRKP